MSGRLADVLDAAEVGIWRLHLPTQLATWNEVAARIITGVGQAQNDPVPLPIHPDDRAVALERIEKLETTPGDRALTIRVLLDDGNVRWVRASARKPVGADLDGPWLVGMVSDVTAEKLAQDAIVEGKRQLATLMDHLPGVAYRCELQDPWRMTYVSKGVLQLTGRESGKLTSGEVAWADLMVSEDVVPVAAEVEKSILDRTSFDLSYRVTTADGQVRWVQERGRAFYHDGEPKFLEGFIWDISAAKRAEEQARWIANHDPLTKLPNRLLLHETVDAKIAYGDDARFSVLLVDVDDFKLTNDTLGHDAGDTLLREISVRLKGAVGEQDFVARLGGDEFAILLDGVAEQSTLDGAGERILSALSVPFHHEMGPLSCSASIGASVFGKHGRCRGTLLKHADIALYAAKAAGRGNLQTFSSHMLNAVQVRSSMLALASSAVEAEGIVSHYQPKVDLRSGEIVGFEALLRWQNAGGSLRTPGDIAAAFDDAVLAASLSDRLIRSVMTDMRSWLDAGIPFHHVAINASPAQFQRGDFADRLLANLDQAGIPTSFLQVEVTETVFLGRGSRFVEKALIALDAAGVRIALDDFGTGYASLLHLAQFPVRTLKIDRSFVAEMMSSQHDDAIIQAVISLGHSLGMKVVAEGVETGAQEARLRAIGCDQAQGFLYAPALPSSQVAAVCATATMPNWCSEKAVAPDSSITVARRRTALPKKLAAS